MSDNSLFVEDDFLFADNFNYRSRKKYYVLHHYFYGCENPHDQYVYDESEIKSSKVQKYIKTHRYANYKTDVYRFELKRWSIDDVVKFKFSNGWTPGYLFAKNGFDYVGEINLIDLFDHIKKVKGTRENGELYEWYEFDSVGGFYKYRDSARHNLVEKRKEIQTELKKFGYKDRDLIIYRTSRKSLFNYWDAIEVFSKGGYSNKKLYRDKINLNLVKTLEQRCR